MKKLLVLLLLLLLISGLFINLYTTDSTRNDDRETTKEVQIKKQDEHEVRETLAKKEEENLSQPVIESSENKELSPQSTERKKSPSGGIELKIDGDELEKSYLSESVKDYGWKSYWENELFVILMESSRAYPFIKQETDCKAVTCKVKVTISNEKKQYLAQAFQSLSKEFSKRNISVAIRSIDVENGVISVFVQPGNTTP